ncbi:hypothetical protein MKW92_020094 [Papaver armeniacum]|nr:hypothetical protein MKW92_020094 [Papaver armeniacum]
MNVLEKLNSLYGFYAGKSLSMFNQGTTSLHVFEVTKGLMEPKVLDWESPKALLEYSASSRQRFFEIICPADSKMIFICRKITKEVIMEIISSERKLPVGQILKVVMLIFVYGNLPVDLYLVIVNRFALSPHWKSFFEQFKDCIDSGIVKLSFLLQIRKSLAKTGNNNWSKMTSYISPFHFSYLLERFLYLVSSWKYFFFTTKSSLLETLKCENWKPNSKSESDTDINLKNELYSLEGRKAHWNGLRKLIIAAKKDYSSLVLRLFILVFLVCINAEDHFDFLCGLVINDDVFSFLPLEFREILSLARPSDNPYQRVLKIIENPLVILYSGKNRPTFSCPDAIFIDMELILCREDILDILNLKRTECVQQDAVTELTAGRLSDKNVSARNIETIIHCSQPSSSFSEGEQFIENEGEHVNDLKGGYRTVVLSENDGVAMNPLALKFNVGLLIRVLDAAIAKSNLNASSVAEDRRFVTEAEIMLGELKQLLAAIRVSCPREEDLQPILQRLAVLLIIWKAKAMETRLSQLSAPFFSTLMVPNALKEATWLTTRQVVGAMGLKANAAAA